MQVKALITNKLSGIVLEDGDSLGRVARGCLPEWFWPNIEVGTRTRRLIKTRIMICLAGAEPEAA